MSVMTEWASKRLLGFDPMDPRETLTNDVGEAVRFAREVGGPVVAKASGVTHKSDRGLVRTGLDADAVATCWHALAAAGDGTVLLAEEVTGDLELIAGGLRDPQFGPVVMIGFGGVFAEVIGDTAFVLAPPESGEVDRALARLRGGPLLDGYRGISPVDRAELHAIIDAISDVLVRDEDVIEIDVNPILVRDGHPMVLDALVVRTDGGAR